MQKKNNHRMEIGRKICLPVIEEILTANDSAKPVGVPVAKLRVVMKNHNLTFNKLGIVDTNKLLNLKTLCAGVH